MITSLHQRWREKRGSYRRPDKPFEPRLYEVGLIATDTEPKNFVTTHHYSGSYPAARVRVGLYRRGDLHGVAVFSHPANELSLSCLPGRGLERIELGRFILLDEVAANGESWFIARANELLAQAGLVGVVAFSDPTRRNDIRGRSVFRGHVGTIYQATNAHYLGRSKSERLHLLPDGSIIHNRALAKIRSRSRGWRYAAAQLEAHGAPQLSENDDGRAWLDEWLPRLTRPLPHPGNHKYAWTVRRRDRRHLPASLPYPKLEAKT